MKQMKKVEMIVEAVYVNRVLELFSKHDMNHYTLIRDVEGRGNHGHMLNDGVSDVSSNDYLFAACSEEKFLEIKEEIRAFTVKYGGKCFVSDTMMIHKP